MRLLMEGECVELVGTEYELRRNVRKRKSDIT